MMNICRTNLLRNLRVGFASILIVAGALFLFVIEAQAKSHCYDNWSEAAVIVEQNKLMKVAALDEMVRQKLDGRIVKTTLCAKDKGYVYKIVVRKAGGQLTGVSVDAKTPFSQ